MIEAVTLSWQTIAGVLPVMVFAGLVHGALGLGFPLVATPIIAVFLDVKLAILITLLPTATVNVASIHRQARFKSVVVNYLPLAIASLLGALFGAHLLTTVDASPFRLLLAALILIFLWTQHSGRLPQQWLLRYPQVVLICVGLLAGFSAGTTNVMVAVLLIYFLSLNVERSEMVTAMNLCFLIGKLSQILVFLSVGLVTTGLVFKTLPLALAGLIALQFGQRFAENIPQERYQLWLRVLLAGLAAILVWQFFAGR